MPFYSRSEPIHRGRSILFVLAAIICTSVVVLSEIPLMRPTHPFNKHIESVKWLLLPHALGASIAFLIGPFQFSSFIRKKYLRVHRLLGKVYVGCVYLSAIFVFILIWHIWPVPVNFVRVNIATAVQASLWLITTTLAWTTARNKKIKLHEAWIGRSYFITASFFLSRMLNPWKAYYDLSPDDFSHVIYLLTILAFFVPDLMIQWRDLWAPKKRMPVGKSAGRSQKVG